jgi:hypothetical protein
MTFARKSALAVASFAVLMAVAAAPVRFDGVRLIEQAAWARHGADDGAHHDRNDDRGRGGHGRDDRGGGDRGGNSGRH